MGIIAYADSIEDVEVIPTGLFIDNLTGIGGIPRGKITEIFGDESVGKSTLCLQLVANAQKEGARCLWADVEWSYTARYGKALGVDNTKLGLIRNQVSEVTLDTIEEAIESGEWDLIVLDSVGGILPRKNAEKSADAVTIGAQARLISDWLVRVVPLLSIHNVAMVMINHSSIDIMSGKIITSGGKKLRYHKSISIRLKPKTNAVLKSGETKVGKVIIGEVRKNKEAPTEGMQLEGQLIFGTGFSAAADLLGNAIDKGVITKKGNTFYFGEEKLGVGMGRTRTAIEEDESLAARIKEKMS